MWTFFYRFLILQSKILLGILPYWHVMKRCITDFETSTMFYSFFTSYLTNYYVVAFSSALAVLNAVPCLKLDGQHIVKCFIIDLQMPCFYTKDNNYSRTTSFGSRSKVAQWRKTFAKILTIFGTVLLVLNVILGCSKSFGFS